MIIGERKCGTTSLYRYLTEHPCVLPCRVKETQFFSGRRSPSLDDYREFFPSATDRVARTQDLDLDAEDRLIETTRSKAMRPGLRYITGEASANVLMTVPPRRIFGVLPALKLIAVVREPVARAFSHHAMHVRFKREGRWQFRLVSPDYRRDFTLERWASRLGVRGPYLAPGRYVESLQRWLDVFPRTQLMVVRTEDLDDLETRRDVVATLCDYLELPPFDFSGLADQRLNVASDVPRDDVTAAELREYFAPFTERLEALVGRSMGWH